MFSSHQQAIDVVFSTDEAIHSPRLQNDFQHTQRIHPLTVHKDLCVGSFPNEVPNQIEQNAHLAAPLVFRFRPNQIRPRFDLLVNTAAIHHILPHKGSAANRTVTRHAVLLRMLAGQLQTLHAEGVPAGENTERGLYVEEADRTRDIAILDKLCGGRLDKRQLGQVLSIAMNSLPLAHSNDAV